MLGGSEILIIGGALVAVLFGPKLLRSLGTSACDSIREFRKLKTEMAQPVEFNDTPNKSDTGHPLPAKKGN